MKPSDDDILLAAEWLDENEGGSDESEPMKRVAVWLREQVRKREEDRVVREMMRQTGASAKQARAVWRRRQEKESGPRTS